MAGAVCAQVLSAAAPVVCTTARQRSARGANPCHFLRPSLHKDEQIGSFFGSRGGLACQRVATKSRCRPSHSVLASSKQSNRHEKPSRQPKEVSSNVSPLRVVQQRVVVPMLAAGVALTLLTGAVPSAYAADALKTCQCLLRNCAAQLAECLENPGCAANIACLNTCNGRPDETECQIKCGDLFQNSVVDDFNKCAVSDKGCVPQKADEGKFPEPKPDALVSAFDTSKFTGEWYISSGLNPIFDTFDCQLHTFDAPAPQQVVGNLTWRINTPDGGFFTRSAVQKFKQDQQQPGILYNHGNEFLHYEDDWYIVSSKIEGGSDDYVFVYYRGRNDAWTGYGGAVVYTRAKTIPENVVPELEAAAKRVGLDYSTFKTTDNSCGPQMPLMYRLAMQARNGLQSLWESVQEEERIIERVIEEDEAKLLKTLGDDERALLDRLNLTATELEELFKGGLPSKATKK